MADSTAPRSTPPQTGYKDTVESILVAFILAFIFRAFVVEAFVIPTGSMAPTLYGAHMRYTCADCGYTFDVGYRATTNATDDDLEIPSDATPTIAYHCPNCGYTFDQSQKPVRFGDRILVLKYLYLFQPPKRWDVVVFKSPDEGGKHVEKDPEYGVNYIKRLISIGPESIVILDGDVYTGPFDAAGPPWKDGKSPFRIQRKPSYAQDALWRMIYNNDFIPHMGVQANAWTQPWQEETQGSGWSLSGPPSSAWPAGAPSRIFEFANSKSAGAISFNPAANDSVHPLTDWLVYDEAEHARLPWTPVNVSDLKLGCDYTRRSGTGPLRLQLSKNADVFTAEVTPGKVRLLRGKRTLPDRPQVTGEQELKAVDLPELSASAPARIELINVDYRVSIRVNGTEVIATTDEQYYPNIKELWDKEEEARNAGSAQQGPFARPMVRIEAQQQEARIEHLSLARDIFYLSAAGSEEFWATVGKITHLNAGEYFVMGDNSFISGDARYWKTRIELPHENLSVESGRVPERFMLGKAFFVYWPAGYSFPGAPVNIVPDFGEMRGIH